MWKLCIGIQVLELKHSQVSHAILRFQNIVQAQIPIELVIMGA